MSPVNRSLQEIADTITTPESAVNKQYRYGINILSRLYQASGRKVGPKALLSMITAAVTGQELGGIADCGYDLQYRGQQLIHELRQLSNEPDAENLQRLRRSSWAHLMDVIMPTLDSNVMQAISRQEGLESFVKPEEYEVLPYQLGRDKLLVTSPQSFRLNPQYNQTMEEIQRVWALFRGKEDPTKPPQKCSVVLIADGGPTPFRSYARMQKDPITVINILDHPQTDLLPIVRHEMIHCVLGAETQGKSISDDYVEGCATRLAHELDPSDQRNRPEKFAGFLELQHAPAHGKEPNSHTQLVRSIEQSGQPIQEVREYSYLFGYALVDAMLNSPHYKRMSDFARSHGDTPFRPIHDMNAFLSNMDYFIAQGIVKYDPQSGSGLRNADLLRDALIKLGYDYDALMVHVHGLFRQWRTQKQGPLTQLLNQSRSQF